MPPIDQFLGPIGALALAVSGLILLARDHRDLDRKLLAKHEEDIAFERARTADALRRLDAALGAMKEHTSVTDRAVALSEAVIARLERREHSRD